jgi:MOSC domain-containing protein YiiM
MKLLSVNIGHARSLENAKESGKTGIFKVPSQEPVQITRLGAQGDVICDTANHGGVDQAIYVYGTTDYRWWSSILGRELSAGTFGENLTIDKLESAYYSIGDRLHIGNAILEITAPRIPCVTLATRMEDPTFARRFREAERPGLYCRVIQEGTVEAGDSVSVEYYDGETVTILEMFRDFYKSNLSAATLRRYLAAPIAIRDRIDKEEQLRKMAASA